MHILHIPVSVGTPDSPISGIYIERLCQAQKSHEAFSQIGLVGVNPVHLTRVLRVISTERKLPTNTVEYTPSVVDDHYTIRRYNKRKSVGAMRYAKQVRKTFDTYADRHGQPDLIHAHSGRGAGLAALFIRILYDIPFVVTEHNPAFVENKIEDESGQLKTVYDTAEKIYVVSEGMQQSVENLTNNSVTVFPNVLDPGFVNVPKTSDREYFLQVGRINENKNQKLAIDAIDKLNNKSNKQYKLIIAGKGNKKEDYKNYCKMKGVDEFVEFVGFVSDDRLSDLYRGAIATLVCSYKEPFGLPIIESLAHGTPVVTTRTAGAVSISEQFNTGVVLLPRDDTEFADAMEEMLNFDQKYRHQIQETAISNYSSESIAELSAKEYKSLL